jgi:uncharacterized protein
MNRTVKAALAAFMLAVGLAGSVAAGPFEDGVAGYMKGDYATALRLLRSLAVQGDADAPFQLGVMYAKGKGVPQDYAAALRLMRPLAEQGAAAAQNNLGVMYHAGQGIPQDNAVAVGWYRKAAEQGNANAQVSLGNMYAKGQSRPRKSGQDDRWSFCLTAGTLCPSNQEIR